jgi:hypothetical protein
MRVPGDRLTIAVAGQSIEPMSVGADRSPLRPGSLRVALCGVAWSISSLYGCAEGGTSPPEDLVFASGNVEFWADPALPICGGTFEFVDGFAAGFAGSLPAEVEAGDPIVYHYARQDQIASLCTTEGALACARGAEVYTASAVQTHEVVHAVRQLAYGGNFPGSSVFEEGLAVYYSSSVEQFHYGGRLDLGELTPAKVNLGAGQYVPAGHFAAFMHETNPAADYQRFVADVAGAQTLDDYAEPYALHTGREWSADLSGYADYPKCPHYAFVPRPVECAKEPSSVLTGEGQQTLEVERFSCADPDAIGPDESRAWGSLVVENPGTAILEVSLSVESTDAADDRVYVDFAPCGGGCSHAPESHAFTETLGDDILLHVAPGRSVLRFAISVDAEADLRFVFTAVR